MSHRQRLERLDTIHEYLEDLVETIMNQFKIGRVTAVWDIEGEISSLSRLKRKKARK